MEMTRFEYLVKQGPEQVAHDVCWAVSEMYVHDECDRCPFTDRCRTGHKGALDYLMEEVEQDG
mgnify:CR=1 FL=1